MRRRRRRFFAISRLQGQLILFNTAYVFVISGTLAGVIVVPLILQMNDASLPHAMREKAAIQLVALHQRIWPGIAVAGFVFILHTVRMTNRLLGPMHRLTQVMRDVARGDLSRRVRIRRDDLLQAEAATFDEMLEGLRGRVNRLKSGFELLEAELQALRRGRSSRDHRLTEAEMARLDDRLNTLRAGLQELETGDEPQPRQAEPAPALPAEPGRSSAATASVPAERPERRAEA